MSPMIDNEVTTKRYEVKVVVEYWYEVEADSKEEAEAQGWEYENYSYNGTVDSITVHELDDDESV